MNAMPSGPFCSQCKLYCTAKSWLWSTGNPDANILLIGEAPGEIEDEEGALLVGPEGDLLSEMLGLAGLQTSDVSFVNILKCRPPDNKMRQGPVNCCSPLLSHQICEIKPQVLVTLGRWATDWVLRRSACPDALPYEGKITRMQGAKFMAHTIAGSIPLFPMLHPRAVLRDIGSQKSRYADAFRSLGKELGSAI